MADSSFEEMMEVLAMFTAATETTAVLRVHDHLLKNRMETASYPDPPQIIEAMKLLVSSNDPLRPGEKAVTEENTFDMLLETNFLNLESTISKDQQFSHLCIIWKDCLNTFCGSTTNICWKFTAACLSLLEILNTSLEIAGSQKIVLSQRQSYNNPDSCVLPAGSNVLSIAHKKVVLTLIQFIVCLGVCPNLQKGVGIPVERRSGFGRLLALTGLGEQISDLERHYRLLLIARVFIPYLGHSQLGANVLVNHLGDILALLFQLCYYHSSSMKKIILTHAEFKMQNVEIVLNSLSKTTTETSSHPLASVSSTAAADCEHVAESSVKAETDEQENNNDFRFFKEADLLFCQTTLQNLMDRVYQPLLIRHLLLLQGGPGPKILKKIQQTSSFRQPLLTEAPSWLQCVCRDLLTEILRKPGGVQYIIIGLLQGDDTNVQPPDWKKLDTVAKMIVKCSTKSASLEEHYKRISPQVIELLHHKDKQQIYQFSRTACSIINAMATQNLQLMEQNIMKIILHPLYFCTKDSKAAHVIVDEQQMCSCITDVHKIVVSGPHTAVLKCLQPVVPVLFTLYCFTTQRVTKLRETCEDIIHIFLRFCDENMALMCLKTCALAPKLLDQMEQPLMMHPNLVFVSTSRDGVEVVSKGSCSFEEESINTLAEQSVKAQCLIKLLVKLEKPDLCAEFVIFLLKELSQILFADAHDVFLSCKPGKELMDLEVKQQGRINQTCYQLSILNLIAAVCESFGPDCLKRTSHVLDFIKVTLERGVKLCENPCQELSGVCGTETLSMAMGLLTILLSGTLQVSSQDHDKMKDLHPLLSDLSSSHCDHAIREMAADLYIAVVTHGTVCSNTMMKTVSRFKKAETKPQLKPVLSETFIPREFKDEGNQSVCNLKADHNLPDCEKVTELQNAFEESCNLLVPIQGHGLISLTRLVQKRDKETLGKKDKIWEIFEENLSHSDSYIYLSAINGLEALADVFPEIAVPRLVELFAVFGRKTQTAEVKLKVGECLVRASRNLGSAIPKYRVLLLHAFLCGAKENDALIRASSLSNLGEVCKMLRFALGGVIHEVFICISNILKSDKDPEVRKAAVVVVTLLLQGLGKDVVRVLTDVMKDLYQLLKLVLITEQDSGVKLQVNLALNELDLIMREIIFAKPTLSKKIKILAPE